MEEIQESSGINPVLAYGNHIKYGHYRPCQVGCPSPAVLFADVEHPVEPHFQPAS